MRGDQEPPLIQSESVLLPHARTMALSEDESVRIAVRALGDMKNSGVSPCKLAIWACSSSVLTKVFTLHN